MSHVHANTSDGSLMTTASATRVVLRPLATALPLGFLGLAIATFAFASVQLEWIPMSEGKTVALGILVLTVPLQFLAAVMGFLSRDPVAATGMGILSGTWAAVCLSTLSSPSDTLSDGLGVILISAAVALLVPALAARTKLVPAAVITLSALRFLLTGVAEINGAHAWMLVAGWTGVVLAGLSVYAALALELEGTESRTILPLGRSGAGKEAVDATLAAQVANVANEPGVRQQL